MKPNDAEWIGPLVHKEILRMNAETKAHFDATVAKVDELERDCALRRLLYDVFGSRTWMIEVARG